jgi:alpha-L-fucosidase
MKNIFAIIVLTGFFTFNHAQSIIVDKNKPEREEWFQSLGFGMFIHWSVDVQIGGIISHNLAGSSPAYQEKYINELPKLFNPKEFDPEEWAKLAKLAGMQYMIFTAKHHNGFCMWDTKTVDFKITNTPYGKDITREILSAFRKYDIPVGFYYSPDDFYLNHIQGIPPSRALPEANPNNNEEMWEIEKAQIRELLTGYGKIDFFFIDEYQDFGNTLVADYCWELDPDLIITRGGMETPEQKLPEKPIPGPWEACFTIGKHWGYVPNDEVKDGRTIINMLIETRAKGGNLLLNVGPDSHGKIPGMQEARLREVALWNMANEEAVIGVKPFTVINEHISSNWHFEEPEHYIWFTMSEDEKVVYAFVPARNWGQGGYQTYFIRSLKGSENTRVSVLGQNDSVMAYKLKTSPKPIVSVVEEGIFVNAIRTQGNFKNWQNPVVFKFENVSYNEKVEELKE